LPLPLLQLRLLLRPSPWLLLPQLLLRVLLLLHLLHCYHFEAWHLHWGQHWALLLHALSVCCRCQLRVQTLQLPLPLQQLLLIALHLQYQQQPHLQAPLLQL
jgi:hypothetical protein